MTQEDVYQLLKKKKKWMSRTEIGEILDIGKGSVGINGNKLMKAGYILRKEKKINNHQTYVYRIK